MHTFSGTQTCVPSNPTAQTYPLHRMAIGIGGKKLFTSYKLRDDNL
jgi:hypothetical protein